MLPRWITLKKIKYLDADGKEVLFYSSSYKSRHAQNNSRGSGSARNARRESPLASTVSVITILLPLVFMERTAN